MVKPRRLVTTVLAGIAMHASVTWADAPDKTAVPMLGGWDLTIGDRDRARPSWVKLFIRDRKPAAEFIGSGGGKQKIDEVRISDRAAYWKIGDRVYRAQLVDGKLTGNVTRNDESPVPLSGERVVRTVQLDGTWTMVVQLPDRQIERTLHLKRIEDRTTGTYIGGRFPEYPVSDAVLDGDQLTFTVNIKEPDISITYHYAFSVQGDRMIGTLQLPGVPGRFEAIARRERTWSEPIRLFNGKDLTDWSYQPSGAENHWHAAEGIMVNRKGGANIFTNGTFTDFKLELEVRVPEGGNSGMYLRGRYEVQVADDHGKAPSPGGMGAVYGRVIPIANASKPAGEWNLFEITFVNYWLTVVLNDRTIVDNQLIEGITGGALDSRERLPGPILLQGDHGPIEYRNLWLTPLAEEQPTGS
jgi:hypothetical protein